MTSDEKYDSSLIDMEDLDPEPIILADLEPLKPLKGEWGGMCSKMHEY